MTASRDPSTTMEEQEMLMVLEYWLTHDPLAEVKSDVAKLMYEGEFVQVVLDNSAFLASLMESNDVEQTLISHNLSELSSLSLAVASLQCFVALNHTGMKELEVSLESSKVDGFVQQVLVDDVDGESLLHPALQPVLLAVAMKLFNYNQLRVQEQGETLHEHHKWILTWWHLRGLSVHQSVMSEASESITQHQLRLIGNFEEDFMSSNKSLQLHLELSHFHRLSLDLKSSEKHCTKALELLGLELSTTGVLGKRTKFQQRDLAQLTIDVTRTSADDEARRNEELSSSSSMPVDVKLNDEVRLDRVHFVNEQSSTIDLTSKEQSAVSTLLHLNMRLQPKDNLTREQLMPFVDLILSARHKNWALTMNALFVRCLVESGESRTLERSLLQLEHLVDSFRMTKEEHLREDGRADNGPTVDNRLKYVYSSGLKAYWHLEMELVKLQMALGSNKAALETALRLQLWDEVVSLYHQLRLRHKAAEVIRQQLSQPDLRASKKALLLCMLGDATDNLDHYHEALGVSNNKSARAYRALGYHHYFKKEYEKGVELMLKSLELNSCQLKLLLRLGYAAMQIGRWKEAAQAYRKYCAYEADNFEAWNNLCNAYVHLGDKVRAWRVLQEALKCDYDNWKIWTNVIIVSIDIGHYEEVFRAYNRLLDLKPRHVDTDVLTIVVRAIENDLIDHQERSCRQQYLESALKLLGRLTAQVTHDENLWQLYARLASLKEKCDWVKVCQYYQKAVAIASRNERIEDVEDEEKREQRVEQILLMAIQYAQAVKSLDTNNADQSRLFLSSARLSLRSLMVKIRRLPWLDEKEALKSECDRLEALVEEMQKLENATSS